MTLVGDKPPVCGSEQLIFTVGLVAFVFKAKRVSQETAISAGGAVVPDIDLLPIGGEKDDANTKYSCEIPEYPLCILLKDEFYRLAHEQLL
jgi:hypothetical protein